MRRAPYGSAAAGLGRLLIGTAKLGVLVYAGKT